MAELSSASEARTAELQVREKGEEQEEEVIAGGGEEVQVRTAEEPRVQADAHDHLVDPAKESSYTKPPPLVETPWLLTGSWREFSSSNHLKGCKWAPDGTCLLACSSDNKIRVYNLPPELYSGPVETSLGEMSPVLTLPLGEVVYDYCWFPLMSSWTPDTACFATTCKDHPVQLWDAFDLHKRASYTPYNHLDELVTPHSLSFSLDGQQLLCGGSRCVYMFDTDRPGRECAVLATQEKQLGGVSGIVSCVAMHPTQPGTFAAGSYSCQVGLYSANVQGPLVALSEVGGGVTHMVFSNDGNLLFAGLRKSSALKVWDLRNLGTVLSEVHREVSTHQRIYFDLYQASYLLSGSTSGHVYGWDITALGPSLSPSPSPLLCHLAHSDCVNGCCAHPTLPLLATASGQRHFPLPMAFSANEDEEEEEEESSGSETEEALPDNCLKLWALSNPSSLASPPLL